VGDGTAGVADYDTAGFPALLVQNATGDAALRTLGNLALGTDSVVMGVVALKTSDVASGIIAELSANSPINDGSFYLLGPSTAGQPSYQTASRGTSTVGATGNSASYAAPHLSSLLMTSTISGNELKLLSSGSQIALSVTAQGAGIFNSYPLHIGARRTDSSPSLRFTGAYLQLPFVLPGNIIPAATADAMQREMSASIGLTY
jgi:hypothetical protein